MRWPAPVSFRSQAFIIGIAALAVFALAVLIARDAVFTTQGRFIDEASRRCAAAALEMRKQYKDRIDYTNDPLYELPRQAQEVSLTGITSTVLLAYPGIKGGMFILAESRITGYAFPDADLSDDTFDPRQVSDAEADFIQSLALQARGNEEPVKYSEWRDNDLIVGAAVASNRIVFWALHRAPSARHPSLGANHWLLALLVLCSLLGVGGIISIWYMLHSGVVAIQKGLHRLENDFSFRLPSIRGDLGQVALDINIMADRRAALEEKLRQQDRLAALGRVVSGVAHEVRNPLNSIKLTLQLLDRRLKKGVALSSEIMECLDEIDRLDSIVGRLLTFGRPAMTDQHRQEIQPVIWRAIRMVQDQAERKKLRLITRFPESAAVADIDAQQIVQVLLNLLLNAIEASPATGAITIAVETGTAFVLVKISDEGERIPDDVRPHIFDAYYTTKPEGNGLGLAVSREIAVNHGGRLEFVSDANGTTFTLFLPVERLSVARKADSEGVRNNNDAA